MCVCLCVYMCVFVCLCVYVCVFVRMCVYVYIIVVGSKFAKILRRIKRMPYIKVLEQKLCVFISTNLLSKTSVRQHY